MITNERQYKITKNQLEAFEQAHAEALTKGPAPGVHPRIHQAMEEGLASQIDDLREQVEQYEALRAGVIRRRVLTSVLDLLPALIEARIAAGLTQKDAVRTARSRRATGPAVRGHHLRRRQHRTRPGRGRRHRTQDHRRTHLPGA